MLDKKYYFCMDSIPVKCVVTAVNKKVALTWQPNSPYVDSLQMHNINLFK